MNKKNWKENSGKTKRAQRSGEFLLYSKLIIIAKRTPF